jgi:hypothetical protein
MALTSTPWTMHRRVTAVLQGQTPDRLPFIGRLEAWYRSHTRSVSLPPPFTHLALPEVHQAVGLGQQKFITPYSLRLCGVEVVAHFEGREIYHEADPLIDSFPGMWDLVSTEKPGVTLTELITPVGRLTLQHEILPEMISAGEDPYLQTHLIKDAADFRTVHYIIDHSEFVPRYERLAEAQAELGEGAFVVPLLHRIPFQQVLLEYLGETATFYALHDHPAAVEALLSALDEQMSEILRQLAHFTAAYVEFPDNLHGGMTNPKLFARYCLPAYQRYTAQLHAQGKKTGSHMDGNMRPLLNLVAESGLDVCESFSPYPLTPCRLEEAWAAWEHGPLIWGGIPSPLLETRTSEADFEAYVERLLALVQDRPIILNVVDLVLGITSITRIQHIAQRVEAYPLPRKPASLES